MPRSKTGAGPGCTGHFSPLIKVENNPRPGQNLILEIDRIGAYFEPRQILVQNNPISGLYGVFFTSKRNEG